MASLLAFDGFHEFELGAAAVQVVVGAMDAEVGVAAEEIGQETKADFERDQLAGKGDEGLSPPW